MASVAEILMAQGRHVAESKRARAGAWVPLVQHLANMPGQIMADRQGERDRALAAEGSAQQSQLRGVQIAKGVQDLEAGDRATADEEAMRTIFAEPGALDNDGTVVWPAVLAAAQQKAPQLVPRLNEAKYKHDDAVAKAAYAAAQEARATQEFDNKQTDRRQAENVRGVRRQIGDFIGARGGQPMTPGDRQTMQGMALQEGIELPKTLTEDAPGDSRALNVQFADAIKRGDKPAMTAIRQAIREAAAAGREPQGVGNGDPGPLETIIGPNGKPIRVARRDALGQTPASGTSKPATGLEKRALNFFNRAEQADKDLEALEPAIQAMGLAGQARMATMPNIAQSQEGQSYIAAQRAFTEARLRKDSGAAIPPHEYDNDRKTYFAQPGDSKKTLEDKRRGRAAILASLAFESGQALGEFIGDADEARSVVDGYKARSAKPADGKKKIGRFVVEEEP